VPDSIRVHLGAYALDDDVDEVILKILGDSRNERDAHRQEQQLSRALDELRGLVLAKAGRVVIDDVAEDERIQEREDLVRCRKHQREQNQRAVFIEIRIEERHPRILLGCCRACKSYLTLRWAE
jgi:hypothetical protein